LHSKQLVCQFFDELNGVRFLKCEFGNSLQILSFANVRKFKELHRVEISLFYVCGMEFSPYGFSEVE